MLVVPSCVAPITVVQDWYVTLHVPKALLLSTCCEVSVPHSGVPKLLLVPLLWIGTAVAVNLTHDPA